MHFESHIKNLIKQSNNQFNSPATEEALAHLEKTIGFMPKELKCLMTCFNGEHASNITPANNLAFFLNIEDIILHYTMLLEEVGSACLYPESHPSELQKVIFDKHWIPFMALDGDVYFMDYNPTIDGIKGQIFMINIAQGMDCYEVIDQSLEALLTKIVHNK